MGVHCVGQLELAAKGVQFLGLLEEGSATHSHCARFSVSPLFSWTYSPFPYHWELFCLFFFFSLSAFLCGAGKSRSLRVWPFAFRPGESSGAAGRVAPMAHTHHALLLLSPQGPAWMRMRFSTGGVRLRFKSAQRKPKR